MKSFAFFGGGNSEYLTPTIKISNVRIEQGFNASLPALDVEEGESWEDVNL